MDGVERVIARIAGRQDNVITLEQLLEAGLGRGVRSRLVSSRGCARAVFPCGEGAVASHRSAAEMSGLHVMLANGLAVMRVTDRHLAHEPVALAVRIGQSLNI